MNYGYKETKINYTVSGEGKPLLILHGWACSAKIMKPVADGFVDKFKVYSIDFPGFGQSGEPSWTWTIYEYADAVACFIKDIIGEKCSIIAHSFGCRVSIILGAKHSDLVDKMIFTGAAGLIKKRTAKYYFKVYSYKLVKKVVSLFGERAIKRLSANAGSADYRCLNDNMKAIFIKVVNEDLRYLLPQIKSSVLLLWGEDDTETPLYFGQIMEKEIEDCALIKLKGGHFAYVECLMQFIKISRVFLEDAQK